MKPLGLLIANLVLLCLNVSAQLDTIYTMQEKIGCKVTELGVSEVKYSKAGNSNLQIVIPRNIISKIVFANTDVMLFDTTKVLYTYQQIINSQMPILSHHKVETDSLISIGEYVCGVSDDYYYSANSRPDTSKLRNIIAIAKYHSADVVLLPENGFIDGPTTDKTGNYSFGVRAEFFTKKLQNFSYLKAMIALNKSYRCKIIKYKPVYYETYNLDSTKKLYTTDTVTKNVEITKIIEKNNRCYLNAYVANLEVNNNTPIDVIYYDSNLLIGEYFIEAKRRKFILELLPSKK